MYVGVIPDGDGGDKWNGCIPHVRGGDPWHCGPECGTQASIPHVRGGDPIRLQINLNPFQYSPCTWG